MTGSEVCNLINSLSKRGVKDSEIIDIIFETEGQQRAVPGEKEEDNK